MNGHTKKMVGTVGNTNWREFHFFEQEPIHESSGSTDDLSYKSPQWLQVCFSMYCLYSMLWYLIIVNSLRTWTSLFAWEDEDPYSLEISFFIIIIIINLCIYILYSVIIYYCLSGVRL